VKAVGKSDRELKKKQSFKKEKKQRKNWILFEEGEKQQQTVNQVENQN